MKIVFLDQDTADIGDLDLSGLFALGDIVSYPLTARDEVANRIAGADIVLSNKVPVDGDAMDAAPNLKAIQVVATGVNNVDLDAARQRNIKVFNVSGYSTPGVAQHVFALLLNLVTKVDRYAAQPARWAESPMFTRLDYPISELFGKVLGIVGYGDIGRSVARIGKAFGMQVVAMARPGGGGGDGEIDRWQQEQFLSECDIITLHCPLTEENRYFINRETLGRMKSSAILINTGRGDLINEADLIEALKSGEIAGAGVDVLSQEPPPSDHPMILADLPNLYITPHTAWSSRESRQRLIDGVVSNLTALNEGRELNRVA